MDRSFRQKINKETADLKDTPNQMNLVGIFRALHPDQQNTHSFQCTWNTFQDRPHVRPQNKSQ